MTDTPTDRATRRSDTDTDTDTSSGPDGTPDADAIGDVAERLATAIGRINRRARTGAASLSYGLVSALASIAQLGPLRPGDLARHEVVTKPTMTRLLGDLESRGFIERADDPSDGRAFVVSATASGIAAVQEARVERAGLVAHLLEDLPEEDISAIVAALGALERVARVAQVDVVDPVRDAD